MASIPGKTDQYPMRTLNSRYGSTRVWTVLKEVAQCGCACAYYEIHPELKMGRSNWKICRHMSHLFDFTGLIIKARWEEEPLWPAPLVGTLSRVASCNSCLGTFLQLMMFEQQMQYMWIYVYVKCSKRWVSQWRMVLCEWRQLWAHIVLLF